MGLLAPGSVLAGYRIESVVGRGGMGVVYRARQLDLDRTVALKVIAPELLQDADTLRRFLKEARTAASIEHPNVIPVHAAGAADGVAYLAMRFIEGDDVRTLVRTRGARVPWEAANIVAQAAAGLDAIHRAGYVHRDIKPANVLVDGDGHIYVTDFGLAKQMLSRSADTTTGHWVGTLDYIAPEQIRGGRVDARADVYALGGVLYFLLVGRVPFERERDEAKLWAQLSDPPPVPSHQNPGLGTAFDAVVGRAMAKEAEDRYPSAGDLARAAHAAATGKQPAQPERVVARGAAAPERGRPVFEPDGSTFGAATVATRPSRRRRAAIPAAGVVVLAAAGAVAVLALTGGPPPHAAGGAATLAQVRTRTATPTPRPPPRAHVTQTLHHVGHRPNGVTVASGDVWVTSFGRRRLARIDGASGHRRSVRARIGVGASSIAASGRTIWVAVTRSRTVVGVDAHSGRSTIHLKPGGAPYRLAAGLGSLWVGTSEALDGGNQLIRYDTSGQEQSRQPILHGIAGLATGSHALWIAQRDLSNILRLDPKTNKTELWARLVAPASAIYYGGGYLWAALPGLDNIVRIDPHTSSTVVTTVVGHRPSGMVAAGGRLFVTSDTDHTVRVVNPQTVREEGAPIHVALNPYAIAADARAVWVTGVGEDTVTRIAYR